MNMVASHSTISLHKSPAMTRKEMKRVARSHPGCTAFQQLVHSWEEPTWFPGIATTVRSLISCRATRRLWYMMLSSHFEASSLLHSTQKDTTRDAATMPRHTISYQQMTSAIASPHLDLPSDGDLRNRNVWSESWISAPLMVSETPVSWKWSKAGRLDEGVLGLTVRFGSCFVLLVPKEKKRGRN